MSEQYAVTIKQAGDGWTVSVQAGEDAGGNTVTVSSTTTGYQEAVDEVPSLIGVTSLPSSMAAFGMKPASHEVAPRGPASR